MPRARNIKHGFFTNDEIAALEPLARLLFIGLWTIADREGRLLDRPKKIKAELLPYDKCDADNLLDSLNNARFIRRYRPGYIQIVNFTKHQSPHFKESPSLIPAPGEPETDPVQAVLIPDTGLLIPDTGNSHASAKHGLETYTSYQMQAKEILNFLNNHAGRAYAAGDANLDFIVMRLREGATADECRMVVARKCREWKGTEMDKYLRPATLFNKTKFAQYQGELVDKGGNHAE